MGTIPILPDDGAAGHSHGRGRRAIIFGCSTSESERAAIDGDDGDIGDSASVGSVPGRPLIPTHCDSGALLIVKVLRATPLPPPAPDSASVPPLTVVLPA